MAKQLSQNKTFFCSKGVVRALKDLQIASLLVSAVVGALGYVATKASNFGIDRRPGIFIKLSKNRN